MRGRECWFSLPLKEGTDLLIYGLEPWDGNPPNTGSVRKREFVFPHCLLLIYCFDVVLLYDSDVIFRCQIMR